MIVQTTRPIREDDDIIDGLLGAAQRAERCLRGRSFPDVLTTPEDREMMEFCAAQIGAEAAAAITQIEVAGMWRDARRARADERREDADGNAGKVETLASEVYKLAALDQLTGLYNRRSGEQRMAQEISRAQRYGRRVVARCAGGLRPGASRVSGAQ